MLEFKDAGRLLDPGPMVLETGVERLPSGVLHVAARSDMFHCKGRMMEWWFRQACNTEEYMWWHPHDHVSSEWIETSATTHVGSTHIVEEKLSGDEVYKLHINFVDPAEFVGAQEYKDAQSRGDVTSIVAAQIGLGDEPARDDKGRPNMGRMAHVSRDTREGLLLRSHFWLGEGTGAPAEALEAMITEDMGLGLMLHANTEFKYLSRVLPSLYIAKNPDDPKQNFPGEQLVRNQRRSCAAAKSAK